MWATAFRWVSSRSLATLGMSREAKEERKLEGKYSMGMAMPWSRPYWDSASPRGRP